MVCTFVLQNVYVLVQVICWPVFVCVVSVFGGFMWVEHGYASYLDHRIFRHSYNIFLNAAFIFSYSRKG